MKKIKIFIASSIVELQADRIEIGNFFRRLNECYWDAGLHFQLIMCEDMSDAITMGRKQEEYNRELVDCDLAFFLFFQKTGEYTLEEFDIAMESFTKTKKPQIMTYFKIDEAQSPTEEVMRFMQRLDQETGHYYNTFGHIDTLKLGMVMQIKLLKLDAMDIQLKDGKAMQGDAELMALDHVEMVNGHNGLQSLKRELVEQKNRFLSARTVYLADPDDNDAYEAFIEASTKQNELKKSIEETETNLYTMMENMFRQISQGGLSARQTEAYRLMERGKYKEAEDILNFDEIMKESRLDEMLADTAAAGAQVHVNELLQLKDIRNTRADWAGVEDCCREATRLEERHNLPKRAMYGYAEFLRLQKRYSDSITVAEKLRYHYQNPDAEISEKEKGDLYQILGHLYMNTQRFTEAEALFRDALEVRKELAERNFYLHGHEMADSYNNLGILYIRLRQMAESESMYKTALEIRKTLTGRTQDENDLSVAQSYNNLGELYIISERFEEAEEMLRSALDVKKKLVDRNREDDRYISSLAVGYGNLSRVFTETKRYEEAEEASKSSLEWRKKLVEYNPGRYESELAKTYRRLGIICKDTQRMEEAERMYISARDVRIGMAKRDPTAFEPILAECYYRLGELYAIIGRNAEAEEACRTALRLYEQYEALRPIYAENAEKTRKILKSLCGDAGE